MDELTKFDDYEPLPTNAIAQEHTNTFIHNFNTLPHTIIFGHSKPETLEHATLNSIVRHVKKTLRSLPVFDRRKK